MVRIVYMISRHIVNSANRLVEWVTYNLLPFYFLVFVITCHNNLRGELFEELWPPAKAKASSRHPLSTPGANVRTQEQDQCRVCLLRIQQSTPERYSKLFLLDTQKQTPYNTSRNNTVCVIVVIHKAQISAQTI